MLVIDRTTAHVVNPTWQDGLQVTLKLWACAVLDVTFYSRLQGIDCSIGKEVANKFLWPMEPPRLDQSISNLAKRIPATSYFNYYHFFGHHDVS